MKSSGQALLADTLTCADLPCSADTCAAGTVTASAESIGGYGVSIMIMSNLNGTMVETRYGHMVYGSRMVEVGDQVAAGQLIGLVGNTGNSYGSHLHFEVRIGGSVLDPEPWLAANAG